MNTNLSPIRIRILSLFLVMSMALSTAFSQNGWFPGVYTGIPVADKQVAFFDEFDNNANKWNLNSTHLKMEINDGDFYCESQNERTFVKKRSVEFNHRGDYEIELRMRYVKGRGTRPMGLTFGRSNSGNEFNFYYSVNGKFQITKFAKDRTHNLVNWKPNLALRGAHSFQTLTVRKVGPKWYFFINREEVYRSNAQPLFGNEVGFTIGGRMAIEVDYIRVSELKTSDSQSPTIVLSEPILDINSHVSLNNNRQSIRGRIIDASGIQKLTINNHEVVPGPSGEFSATLRLPEGKTRIVVAATDKYDNKSQKVFFAEYMPQTAQVMPPPRKRPSKLPIPSKQKTRGNTYLLTIGINRYKHWGNLHNAIKDSRDIGTTLINEYQFEEHYTYRLFDNEATRENILETLEKLQDIITPDDNLLIYYAGHGYYDKGSKRGYWVPVNARQNKIPDYIRNSTIHDYLNGINTHNTLLVVDACFAGSLFSHSRTVLNETNPSRWAFTSGDIQKVWDGQPGENSPFAKYLIHYLKQNRNPRLRADNLIDSVKAAVTRNADQNPMGSPLQNVGDMGGVFVFIRK